MPRGIKARPSIKIEVGQNWIPTQGSGPCAGRNVVALWTDAMDNRTVRYETVRNRRKPEAVTVLILEAAFRSWIVERAAVIEAAAQDAA